MYFHKIRHPANFAFSETFNASSRTAKIGGKSFRYSVDDLGSDVFHLEIEGPDSLPNLAQSHLQKLPKRASRYGVAIGTHGEIVVGGAGEKPLISSLPRSAFGVCGKAWVFPFQLAEGTQFYGMGEKNIGFEKSNHIWGDFSHREIREGQTDPMYVSTPYFIVKQGNTYVGILIDNPYPVFIDTGSNYYFDRTFAKGEPNMFYFGSDEGLASIYFLVGPSLHELTCKMQQLCGTTPLPPLWALGHNQCRWGYRGTEDLKELDEKFTAHKIPDDGLWLDIDYMDMFRVFTFNPKHFKNVAKEIAALRKNNRYVVPILDPGVKLEKGYKVYDDGVKKGMFCKTPQGLDYVGFVWPGKTVFPDFSLPKVRAWWAAYVKAFAETGVAGAWLDMNDPSTGAVEVDDMLFGNGKLPHTVYHNQYALGMAQASHAGFLAARPHERPFLLARSGFTGQSKYSAIWTGDNFANRHHMKNAVQITMSLALSGIPFNGPDVGGFGGHSSGQLLSDWYKAGFLFPFFRNHAAMESNKQEPWAYDAKTLAISKHYISTRYKLLPYLYNLFVDQEEQGTAIMRPLFYDFEDTARLPLGKIDDQFLIGPAILQAPIYEEKSLTRELVLPGKTSWFAAHEGKWIAGNRKVKTRQTDKSTPLYVREGAVVPMQAGTRTTNNNDLGDIELHLFLKRSTRGTASYQYRFDDGHSFDYRAGKRTSFRLNATVKGSTIHIQAYDIQNNYLPAKVRFVVYDKFKQVVVEGLEQEKKLALKSLRWDLVGKPLSVGSTAPVVIK
jgi:alpha-glucosidase